MKKLVGLVGIVVLMVGSFAQAGVRYTITDLGTFGGNSESSAQSINEIGQISVRSLDGNSQSFIWENGVKTGLYHEGVEHSQPHSINDAGQVVGSIRYPQNENTSRAALWENGQLIDLGTDGAFSTEAYSINNSGQIVGSIRPQNGSSESHAIVWNNGVASEIGTLDGYSYGRAYGINDVGQIIGNSFSINSTVDSAGFLWENGQMTNLGSLDGGRTIPWDINMHGQVIGISGNHAFRWEDGIMTDLGVLDNDSISYVGGINDSGQVVGHSTGGGWWTNHDAVLWDSDGSIFDLNDLVIGGSEWNLIYAMDITVIALWLGHESPVTTHMYIEADLTMKEKALQKLQEPGQQDIRYHPSHKLLQFLQGL